MIFLRFYLFRPSLGLLACLVIASMGATLTQAAAGAPPQGQLRDALQEGPPLGPVTVHPEEYPKALRNPLKGFRPYTRSKVERNRFMTLGHHYIKWNEIEQSAADDVVANLKAYSEVQWSKFDGTGVKVIPRVYLDWDRKEGNEHWPADMETGDYSSPEFKRRVQRLIAAMGACWDEDPRVAWVQMGIIGFWGEHHSPSPTEEMQALLGAAFEKAFTHKKVLVRHAHEFEDFQFGIYWDSWAHYNQTFKPKQGAGIERLNEATGRWKTHPIEGEVAYNWGKYQIQAGDNPNDTLSDPVHRDFLIDTIRNLHGTALGWVSNYDQKDPVVVAGADLVQRVLGYRFVIERFSFTPEVRPSGQFACRFVVKNTGSAPIYANWPVQVNFLHPETRAIVWSRTLEDVDIRTWLPGEDWDEEKDLYRIPAQSYTVTASLPLPPLTELPKGEYIVALSIPDPGAGGLGVRFAIKNYFKGDLHPLGLVAYGVESSGRHTVNPGDFDDPMGEAGR